MTITAYFGDEPVTVATSDVTEAADSCTIEAGNLFVGLPITETADSCAIAATSSVQVTLPITETADGCNIMAGPSITATMVITEAGDSCAIAGSNITIQPKNTPFSVLGAGDDFTIIVPSRDYTAEVP